MMTSKELNIKLITTFPELETQYREETEWQDGDDTGSHSVYEHVLTAVIKFLLRGKNFDLAKIYLEFVESILASGDEYADEVAAISVIESLVYDKFDENDILPLLGPESLKTWRGYDDWKRK